MGIVGPNPYPAEEEEPPRVMRWVGRGFDKTRQAFSRLRRHLTRRSHR